MADIDFDELDRAVSGALGTSASEPTADAATQVPESNETPAIEHLERTLMTPSTPNSPKVSPPPAPAMRRSSGRFMDIVHPSSDMRSPNGTPSMPTQAKPAPITPAEPVVEAPEAPAWNEPLESPFLPDAKVEKRPLGGGEALAPAVTDSFDFQGLLDEPEEELLEAPEPQELLEPTSMPDPIDFAAASAVTTEIETKALETKEPAKVEEVPTPEEPAETPIVEEPTQSEVAPVQAQPEAEEPVGPTSITPQYKEQPSSNQESGAIYDTESYHQPVVQPVKKKSGWFTVMWIVILIVLGAAAGWAVYNYVLPTL